MALEMTPTNLNGVAKELEARYGRAFSVCFGPSIGDKPVLKFVLQGKARSCPDD